MAKLQKERFDKILLLLKENKFLTYEQISEKFKVSLITIRRDVIKMESLGLLNRIKGGVESNDVNKDIDYDIRTLKNLNLKKMIAKNAKKYIKENTLIYLDAGTTVNEIIGYMKNMNLKVVTNGVSHIDKLIKNNIDFLILGGTVKHSTKSIIGAIALDQLMNYNFHTCFIGANGIDIEKGITTPDEKEAILKKIAIKNSKNKIVLADSTKKNKVSNVKICSYKDVLIITEKGEI